MITEEKDLLEISRTGIERSLGWGSSNSWTNQDFEELSDRIFDKTEVRLSVSTLKRIWGKVKYDSSPNTATLNALAVFLGYENWKSFRQQQTNGHLNGAKELPPELPVEMPQTGKPISQSKNKTNRYFTYLAAGVLIAIAVIIFMIRSPRDTTRIGAAPVSFESHKVTDDLPNSVIFDYDVSNIKADSFFIQQNWDPRRREKISATGKQHTSIYFYPGNFTARLVANNEVKKTSRVFIQTKGWKGIIDKNPIPIYLSDSDIAQQAGMGVSADVLKEKTGTTVFNEIYTQFYNVREFGGLTLNNFVFKARLQNTSSVEQSVCKKTELCILAVGTAIVIPLTDKGCISDINILTGDTVLSGKQNDFSKFGVDFNKPHDFKCEVNNGRLNIYIDEELIFSTLRKTRNDAEIIGLKFGFLGTGSISNLSLGEPGKSPVYEQDFSKR